MGKKTRQELRRIQEKEQKERKKIREQKEGKYSRAL